MFGFKTVVVGNLPNTKLAAAIAAAKEQDGTKIDHTEIVRVHQSAWLGDWIAEAVAILAVEANDPEASLEALTAHLPDFDDGYVGGDIPGAPQPEDFYLSVGGVSDRTVQIGDVDRKLCSEVAVRSLVINVDDAFEAVYAVVLTEATYTKANSQLMLNSLAAEQHDWVSSGYGINLQIRVFVVKDDGSVEMHKL